MLEPFLQTENWVAFATLILLEVVLGIDNIVFIAIVSERVEEKARAAVRRIGLGFALITRILLLLALAWVAKLATPLFAVGNFSLSAKELVLLGGGLFLITKATLEIYRKTEAVEEEHSAAANKSSPFWGVVAQIILLDLIFSLESIITAVGMVGEIVIMVLAVLFAVAIMIIFVDLISKYIAQHVSLKLLALSFLILIGVLLVAEGTGVHFPRGYVYFAMAFALFVQLLNIRYEMKTRARIQTKHELIKGESDLLSP